VELCDYYGTLQAVPYVAMRRKLFQAGDAVSDLDFWIELGKRMGYGEHFPWRDSTEALDYAIEPSGLTIADVGGAADGGIPFGKVRLGQYAQRGGFATPSKKVELWSATLDELGHDGVPRHVDSPQRPGVEAGATVDGRAADYPLVLTTGARTLQYLHSEYRDVERLARRAREPQAEIHPQTAATYGLNDGTPMRIETARGSIVMQTKVTDTILPGVIAVPHGWERASVNDLTDDAPADPVIGYPILKSTSCRVLPLPVE
jgi:anaerobic selenocysteine-containing dehydrogenase